MHSVFILIFALIAANFVLMIVLSFAWKKYVDHCNNNVISHCNLIEKKFQEIHGRIDEERDSLQEKIKLERSTQYESLFNTYQMFQKDIENIRDEVKDIKLTLSNGVGA